MSTIPPLTYLVVEDHGFQRWLITSMLERFGAKAVFQVADGRAALEVLARLGDSIDVVVSDLDMPGMDGMALIRHMGEQRRGASLIVVSAHAQSILGTVEAMTKQYGVNFLAAIRKPLNAAKLEAALALRQKSREPPSVAITYDSRQIEAGLRAGEFEAFFQPKVEIRTGALRGAEALARWRRPYEGIVAPEAFIDTLQSAGLVDRLTRRMTRSAMEHCRGWHEAGLKLTVSVNLSALSLSDPSLAEEMRDLANEARIEPRFVIFEITESAAAQDLGRKLENLTRLRMSGFGLSIDDFGTGYSSMQRLKLIPFSELKVDQSFVRNIATDPACRAMVESSIDLAKKLGLNVVAEGVESHDQWEILLALGCHLAQGFHIARPIEALEFLQWATMRGQARIPS